MFENSLFFGDLIFPSPNDCGIINLQIDGLKGGL
jgi:hypothetical protein